jgi:hypothetical protein
VVLITGERSHAAEESVGDKVREAKEETVEATREAGKEVRQAGREVKKAGREVRQALITRCAETRKGHPLRFSRNFSAAHFCVRTNHIGS